MLEADREDEPLARRRPRRIRAVPVLQAQDPACVRAVAARLPELPVRAEEGDPSAVARRGDVARGQAGDPLVAAAARADRVDAVADALVGVVERVVDDLS